MSNVGSILKKVRESREISLEKVAAHTKISLLHLKAIEENNWNVLPASPYVKGFLRIYATYLGLDPTRIIEEYENELKKEKVFSLQVPKRKGWHWPRALFWFILFVLVSVGLILWYWSPERKIKTTSQTQSLSPIPKNLTSSLPTERKALLVSSSQPPLKKHPSSPPDKESALQASLVASSPNQGLNLQRIVVCLDIKDHEPVHFQNKFHFTKPTPIYCFTEIIGAKKPTIIKHLWYYKDKLIATVSLPVKSPRWRTWSKKTVYPDAKSEWKVIVSGSKGETLGEICFSVN